MFTFGFVPKLHTHTFYIQRQAMNSFYTKEIITTNSTLSIQLQTPNENSRKIHAL